MTPRYSWRYDERLRAYVILWGATVYQVIATNRHNPARTETYAQRSVDILNREVSQ